MQMVGPILVENAKPLPSALANFLDEALSSGHPAIYVSMGTLAMLSETELLSMAQGLSALSNSVLWKLDSQVLPGVSQPNSALQTKSLPNSVLLASLLLCVTSAEQ